MQMDVSTIRESYRIEELRRIGLIPGRQHAADLLRKEVLSLGSAICKLMTSNELGIDAIRWETEKREYIITQVDAEKGVRCVLKLLDLQVLQR